MQIAKDLMVSIDYKLFDDEGTQLDGSGDQPLQYIHGNGILIPGLEAMLEGKEPGSTFRAVIKPEEAYGVYNESLVVKVPRNQFDDGQPVEVGMKFQATTQDGQVCLVRVTEISDDTVTVDANHELAGKQLTFDIDVKDVREATEEELAGLGGCGCGCGGGCGGCGGDCGEGDCGCGGDCGCN